MQCSTRCNGLGMVKSFIVDNPQRSKQFEFCLIERGIYLKRNKGWKYSWSIDDNLSIILFHKPVDLLTGIEYKELEFYKLTGFRESDIFLQEIYSGDLSDDHHLFQLTA